MGMLRLKIFLISQLQLCFLRFRKIFDFHIVDVLFLPLNQNDFFFFQNTVDLVRNLANGGVYGVRSYDRMIVRFLH